MREQGAAMPSETLTVPRSKRGLIVVDVQNCFCPGGSLPVDNGDEVVPVINVLMPKYDVVVATQDWHPENHVSFASAHGREPFTTMERDGHQETLWPPHCLAGTADAALRPDLDQRSIDLIVRKGTESDREAYSGFQGTGLTGYLKAIEVTDVDVVGLAYDYCVQATARDAVAAGFHVRVLAAATKAVFPDRIPELESALIPAGIDVVR